MQVTSEQVWIKANTSLMGMNCVTIAGGDSANAWLILNLIPAEHHQVSVV